MSHPIGFGFFDACEYEPKADNTAWIIKDVLPKNAFGFVAGPAKGNASPHGGKSVLERKMALSIIQGGDFLGFKVLETGRVMFVNLDEDQDKQVRLYYRMTKGKKIPGYLISRATSMKLPEQMAMLEEDIKNARPLVVFIDPLQRVMGGKEVKEQAHVGPIIDGLKNLSKKYEVTIILNHHSNKNTEREKETTASWLSGSNDLDAAWDFCICVEFIKDCNAVLCRNFQKEKAKIDFYYEAEIINKDEIIDLWPVLEELRGSPHARSLYNTILKTGETCQQSLSKITGISASTVSYQIGKFPILKSLIGAVSQIVTEEQLKINSSHA